MDSFEIYKDEENNIEVEVYFDDESVWLNQNQIASLFGHTKQNVSLHISNIYKERELSRSSTVKQSLTVQKEGKRSIKRKVINYNLDVIISVGYRVRSKRGVQFRQWATKRLKEILVEGYSINLKKLEKQTEKIKDLKNTIQIISRIPKEKQLEPSEAKGLIDVITQYSFALDTLDEYDYQRLTYKRLNTRKAAKITYEECISIISQLKSKFNSSKLFGKEKDSSFKSSINTLFQTFDKKELYPGFEEKCAILLYLIIKNHSFVDGNKRIAASIFIWFLSKNNSLYNTDGSKKISDNELVALCLMIASSDPKEKDIILKVIVKLLSEKGKSII